jgi:hypothetical protein
MGVWGTGLYSGDFARDLLSEFKAVIRLPFDGEKLLELLCDLQPGAANNPADEDHTTFWLVAADQFAKHGIACERARQKAIQIIDEGTDTAMLARLGMDAAGLRKRGKMLADLRQSLTGPPKPAKPRAVIKSPQELVMDVGDVFVFPTSRGRAKEYCPASVLVIPPWERDGWNAAVMVAAERAFGFLAWYRPLTLASTLSEEPDFNRVRSAAPWILKGPGTCKRADLKRLAMKKIGTVPIDREKLMRAFPSMRPGTRAALSDRSIDRELGIGTGIGQTYIYAAKLRKTPEGQAKLRDLAQEATERYEKIRAREASGPPTARRDPTIPSLDEILS